MLSIALHFIQNGRQWLLLDQLTVASPCGTFAILTQSYTASRRTRTVSLSLNGIHKTQPYLEVEVMTVASISTISAKLEKSRQRRKPKTDLQNCTSTLA